MAKNEAYRYQPLEGFQVELDDVVYMPSLDAPSEQPHPFVYFISIVNHSTEQVKITGRKWIVSQKTGETIVVEGDGVVGQSPLLEPGEKFSYNSYHVTATDANVRGAFFGVTAAGEFVTARIPDFLLELPDWA